MANGSHKEGPARADRLREKYKTRGKLLQQTINTARELPPYRDEMDSESEITGNWKGITAKGLPRPAMLIIGYALGVAIVLAALAGSVAYVIRAWPR